MTVKRLKNKRLMAVFWDLGIGGVQTRLRGIVQKSLDEGAKVKILLERRSEKEVVMPDSDNLIIEHFRTDKYEELKSPFRRFERFRFLFWLIDKTIGYRPTDVLVFLNRFTVFMVITRIWLRLRKIDFHLVGNEGILTSKYLKQYEAGYWKTLVKIFYRHLDKMIVATDAVKKDLVENFGMPGKKIRIIPSWVETKKELISDKKKYDLIYAGRLAPEKGISIMIDLAREIKKRGLKYKMAIIGEGELRSELIKALFKYELESVVDYLGYQKNETTLQYIAKSKLFLLPSRNEGLPIVVLEANSLRVPAAMTPFLGVEAVSGPGVNWVFKKSVFVNKVMELLVSRSKITSMGVKANEFYLKNFSLANRDKFVEEIFKDD